ncbi:hypothetical protein [Chryseosolibacter indicus]|uniref:DUF4890 domain-containing protein n=1 Tax=Chryseosolibacter indicus TaxID=2782351 RepID=A0ABS5VSZ4_9BACT|nr:hypothetical protein [Chryseosolibacter indicus]MBT1703994.1 hypothetical protein [Chryseosolibacter indicus]
MKKNVMLVVFMVVAVFGFAQHGRRDASNRVAGVSERMQTVMTLNEEQYASVKKINTKYFGETKQLRADSTLSREEKKNRMKKIQNDKEAELKAVVTDEQFNKWETYKENSKKRRATKSGRKGEELRRFDLDELSLSDDQQKKFEEANKEFFAKHKAIREDVKLTDEQKKTARRELKTQHDAKIKSILTDAQYQKWLESKADRKKHRRKK